MKNITLLILCIICFGNCQSQVATYDSLTAASRVKQQAGTMAQLLLKSNFKAFAKYTYPAIVDMMGGEKKMIETLKLGLKEMKSGGFSFLNVTIGQPSAVIRYNDQLQCTLPQTIEMKVPKGRLVSTTTLIAVSINDGVNWYFVDASDKPIETIKKVLPDLSDELILTPKQQPTFYKE